MPSALRCWGKVLSVISRSSMKGHLRVSKIKVRLAIRDWDYITPLALGDIASDKIDVEVNRVAELPSNLETDERFDASEISFAKYLISRSNGEDAIVGLPHFLMRAFRQRSIIVAKHSDFRTITDLKGGRVGLSGWPDTGNTWTRALFRREGIDVEDIRWHVGRVTDRFPITDRLGRWHCPGMVEKAPDDRPLVELVENGGLDAFVAPFMPPSVFEERSKLRPLLTDVKSAEIRYFQDVGYTPGMHILGVKRGFYAEKPWVAAELSRLIEQSQSVWTAKRLRYADTTPWIMDNIMETARVLSSSWNDNGSAANKKMTDDLIEEQNAQGLVSRRITSEDVFETV